VTNLGNTRNLKIAAGTIARVGITVRTGATVKAKTIHRIGKIRETKKPCSTRNTTR
jgi:hypothetical protein